MVSTYEWYVDRSRMRKTARPHSSPRPNHQEEFFDCTQKRLKEEKRMKIFIFDRCDCECGAISPSQWYTCRTSTPRFSRFTSLNVMWILLFSVFESFSISAIMLAHNSCIRSGVIVLHENKWKQIEIENYRWLYLFVCAMRSLTFEILQMMDICSAAAWWHNRRRWLVALYFSWTASRRPTTSLRW